MPTTIQDVARRAGVSIATVSRVLNRSTHPVRAEVRARVEAAARELDFRPSSLARALAGRETRTLALVVPDIANPYYPRLLRGAEDVASAQGYALIVCNTDYQESKLSVYLRLLREKRVDGVLLAGGGHEDPADLAELRAAGLPILAIGRHPLDVPSVRVDNVAAGRVAVEHLLGVGCRRIAYVGGPAEQTTMADRRQGYRLALEATGLTPRPALELTAELSPGGGVAAAEQLLRRAQRFDGVFAANDNLAIGLINRLLAAGCRVPDDVAVIGFDDIPLAQYFRPSLSSVAVPAYELGSAAAERLLARLGGEQIDGTLWLETSVVARDSTHRGGVPSDGRG